VTASIEIPGTETLVVRRQGWRLFVTLNRPRVKNAMSFQMVEELQAVLTGVALDRSVRAIVLRGAEGNLCAGGDVKDMARARFAAAGEGEPDPLVRANRTFGRLVEALEEAPQATIVVAEGAVMGGGFGLACVADVTVAKEGARFRLPETGLGLPPAQIAPFLVRRLGLTEARRLAVTGGELDAAEAVRLGLAHRACPDDAAVESAVAEVLERVGRCAPGAVATTKALVLAAAAGRPLPELLDEAAEDFARAVRSDEGAEGTTAFLEKRAPSWAEEA